MANLIKLPIYVREGGSRESDIDYEALGLEEPLDEGEIKLITSIINLDNMLRINPAIIDGEENCFIWEPGSEYTIRTPLSLSQIEDYIGDIPGVSASEWGGPMSLR